MTELSTEPFQIGIVCQYPNIFAQRPAIPASEGERPRPPVYSVRFDVFESDFEDAPEQIHSITERYARYLPSITVMGHKPPIITAAGGNYETLLKAIQIAQARRLFMDGLLIDERARITVEWFEVKDPRFKNKWALSLREIIIDEFDLLNRATD